MLFDKPEAISLLFCPTCKATGFIGFNKCKECGGMSVGHFVRGHWLFWFFPLTRYHLNLAKARRIFFKVRFISLLLLWLNAWGWGTLFLYKKGLFSNVEQLLNWTNSRSLIQNLKGIEGLLI